MPHTALTQCLTRRLVAPRTAHLVCHRWDLTILLALLFTATMLPFEVAFAPNVQTTPLPFVINRIVDAVYICDGKDLSSPPSSPLALPLSLYLYLHLPSPPPLSTRPLPPLSGPRSPHQLCDAIPPIAKVGWPMGTLHRHRALHVVASTHLPMPRTHFPSRIHIIGPFGTLAVCTGL